MKKKTYHVEEPMPEVDFSGGVRGKYAKRFSEASNVVLIDADLMKWFPTSEAVNDALRMLVTVAQRQPKRKAA